MYQLDCSFCAATVETQSVESVKDGAKTHLREHHGEAVAAELADRYGGASCRNDCGYTVPVGVESVAGLECPECGHDNFPSLLEQYVYWKITEE